MLALTDSAKDALRQIVEDQQAPEGSGLRIAAESLAFDLATEPSAGDTILEAGGARVFLDETAAAMLDDKVLDATSHEDHVHLTVEDQDSDAEA
jgi:Fe-S cluster assembly iron-binding protein IscA